jgi:hypothetical protein
MGKQFETRGWRTGYRGPFAIHAGGKKPSSALNRMDVCDIIEIGRAIGPVLDVDNEGAHAGGVIGAPGALPLRAVIATGELVGCWPIDHIKRSSSAPREPGYWKNNMFHKASGRELAFGDWRPGRYAWELANVEILQEPAPARGRQGLWEWACF